MHRTGERLWNRRRGMCLAWVERAILLCRFPTRRDRAERKASPYPNKTPDYKKMTPSLPLGW